MSCYEYLCCARALDLEWATISLRCILFVDVQFARGSAGFEMTTPMRVYISMRHHTQVSMAHDVVHIYLFVVATTSATATATTTASASATAMAAAT